MRRRRDEILYNPSNYITRLQNSKKPSYHSRKPPPFCLLFTDGRNYFSSSESLFTIIVHVEVKAESGASKAEATSETSDIVSHVAIYERHATAPPASGRMTVMPEADVEIESDSRCLENVVWIPM
ncbi:hypothetical protein ACFE04_021263 [Oxalis oulophora]